jgi:hypothetical protein
MNYGSLVEQMIYYFKKTGIDPKDAINQNPSVMVSALDKRIVSFLKVQERDILKPLRQDVFNYQNLQKEETIKLTTAINKLLNQHSERINEIKINDADRTKLMLTELEKNRKAILAICRLVDEKNKSGIVDKLKSIFS